MSLCNVVAAQSRFPEGRGTVQSDDCMNSTVAHLALITMVTGVQRVTGRAVQRWQILAGIIIPFSETNERKGVAPPLAAAAA